MGRYSRDLDGLETDRTLPPLGRTRTRPRPESASQGGTADGKRQTKKEEKVIDSFIIINAFQHWRIKNIHSFKIHSFIHYDKTKTE